MPYNGSSLNTFGKVVEVAEVGFSGGWSGISTRTYNGHVHIDCYTV